MSARTLAIAAAVVAVVVAIALSPAREWAIALVTWARDRGAVGAVIYAIVYLVAAVALIPGSALTLGAGFVYGPLWGTLLVIPASILAAFAAFAIARRLARDAVARRVARKPRFAALDRAVERAGFKITLLVRLSPILPYGLLNYALGITRVRFRDYAAATAIGMLPGTILYVYLGSLVTSAAELGSGGGRSWLYWVGGAVTLALTIAVTVVARRELRRELDGAAA